MKPCRIQAISLILAGMTLTLYESNNGLPETESFRRGHGGLGSRGSLFADRNSRLWENCRIKSLTMGKEIGAQNPKSRERPSSIFG